MTLQKHISLEVFGQYRKDIFTNIDFPFVWGKTILDVGCWPAVDSQILRDFYHLNVTGIDIYKHADIDKSGIAFTLSGVYNIPFADWHFDYVFAHDILHHIDEATQSIQNHKTWLLEMYRVLKPWWTLILIEANRYNLLQINMVWIYNHQHFTYNYFQKLINTTFPKDTVKHRMMEVHTYPWLPLWFWRLFEKLYTFFVPQIFWAYNIVFISKPQQ